MQRLPCVLRHDCCVCASAVCAADNVEAAVTVAIAPTTALLQVLGQWDLAEVTEGVQHVIWHPQLRNDDWLLMHHRICAQWPILGLCGALRHANSLPFPCALTLTY